MKYNDKPSQSDKSARLDALLSDFLNKDVIQSSQATPSARATNTPLGDPLLADVVAEPKSSPDPLRQTPAQKVSPMRRTDVWEATSRPASTESSALSNLAADQLEKNVSSILGTSAVAARGRRRFLGWLTVVFLLGAGIWLWRSWRPAVAPSVPEQAPVTASQSEIDAPAETTFSGVSASETHSGSSEADRRIPSNYGHRDGRFTIPVQVPVQPSRGAPSTMSGPGQSAASTAARLQQLPVPSLGNSKMPLGTIQDLTSVQPAPPPLPLPSAPPTSATKEVLPDTHATTATPAVPLTRVQPTYPEFARRLNVKGTVRVEIVVDNTGKVTSAKAVDGPPALRASAELAVKQWRFKPATMNGWRVTSTGTVLILFNGERQ